MSFRVDHLNRYVSDVNKFIGFYQDVLGYSLIAKGKKGNGQSFAILRGEDHELFISEKEQFELDKTSNFRHIGYFVPSIDELKEKLVSKGYISKEHEIITKRFSRQIYIKDPDGLEIDLIQWTDKEGFYRNLEIE